MPVSPINRSVSPQPQPRQSTLNQLQQKHQQFQQVSLTQNKSSFTPTKTSTVTRVNVKNPSGLDASYKSSFLDQQIYEQFKDKKIDFQIFANNLV